MNLPEIAALPLLPYEHKDLLSICRVFIKIQVNPVTDCWIWIGQTNEGYGATSWHSRFILTHILVFNLLKGTIDAGLQLDHLCRVRRCANPDHLEPVTQFENLRRARAHRGIYGSYPCTHAKTPENILVRPGGNRRCGPCEKERNKRRYAANPDRLNQWLKNRVAALEAQEPGAGARFLQIRAEALRDKQRKRRNSKNSSENDSRYCHG